MVLEDSSMRKAMILAAILGIALGTARAEDQAGYPYPVKSFAFQSQRQDLQMAYMDELPDNAHQGTFLLLHGKNFNGAYWHQTIDFLTDLGYRVIVPDQIGFGRSSLPDWYHYSFDQLAANTRALLRELDEDRVTVMGHSMGGMLAIQFALQYPDLTEELVLLNPIGLEDWRAMGVPFVPVEDIYKAELKKDYQSIKAYQHGNYYDGRWSPRFDRWARMLAEQYQGDQGEQFAWNMALTADMILSQPLVYEFPRLAPPTTLLIGLRDRTAIGRDRVSDELARHMGDYTTLGKKAAERIPNAQLIEFDNVGHLPHIEAPERYLDALRRIAD